MAEIKPLPEADPAPDRIPLEEVYMRMAEELAKRSTCLRLRVGTVITPPDITQVLGIGYNGNARGLPNRCDSTTPGACGCIHSEMNAVIKAGAQLAGKVMFVSASPCVMCARWPSTPMSRGSITARPIATQRASTCCARVGWRSSTTTAGATSGARRADPSDQDLGRERAHVGQGGFQPGVERFGLFEPGEMAGLLDQDQLRSVHTQMYACCLRG